MCRTITRAMLLTIGLGSVPALGGSCATSRAPRAQVTDAGLAMRVGGRLAADPDVHRYEIDVDVLDGVVTLRGIVDTDAERQEAVRLAQRTPGVVRVENKIHLESEVDHAERSDLLVRIRVGTKLAADPDVRRTDIDVDVEEGIVSLSGVVYDDLARTEAEKIARSVDGVREVNNELRVAKR